MGHEDKKQVATKRAETKCKQKQRTNQRKRQETKTRNITLEKILAMARVRKTGWHHGERQNEPTKT